MTDTITQFLQKPWVTDLSLLLLIVIIFNLVIKRLLEFLANHFTHKQQFWRASFFEALYPPTCFFVWVYAFFWCIVIIDRNANSEPLIGSTSITIPIILGIIAAGWFFMRWKRLAFKAMTENNGWEKVRLDPQRIDAVDKIFTLVILFIVAALLLEVSGQGVGTLLTIGGISAAAVGFAAKDLIANFFGGLMIYINTPFKKGDFIKIPGKDTTGHVEEIGWYMTRVRDLEKLPVFIPNSMFSQTMVINLSNRSHRRIFETIAIRYQDFSCVKAIIEEFQAILDQHESLQNTLPRFVAFSNYNNSSLDIQIMAYSNVTSAAGHRVIKQELLFKLHEIVTKHGAYFAHPTMTVHMGTPNGSRV